jgi:L-iditol 2-dehydrogenase
MQKKEMVMKIPEKMKALVLPAAGAFEIQEVAVPKPGPFEVLCRIGAVAICGSDPEIIHGGQAGYWPPYYPFVPGHEWAGEIVALGENVQGLNIGDRVAGEAWKGCGHCTPCRAGRYNLCRNYGCAETGMRHYGFRNQGAYAQYNAYSVKSIHPMPAHVSFREGALVDTAGVSLHGIELTGLTAGGTVAVIGPGPIGLTAMRLAKVMGASRVIAVGRRGRLEAAGRLGADELVDIEKQDPVEAVRALTGNYGADEVFEASGAEGTLAQAIGMVKPGGRIGLLGVPNEKVREKIPFKYVCRNEIVIIGVKANPNVGGKIVSLIASGKLNVKDLITHTFPLDRFAEALDIFENRRNGAVKVVIEPNGGEG